MQFFQELVTYFQNYPYIAVLLAFGLILVFIPIAEEVILFTGGYLASRHDDQIWLPTLLAGILGVFLTDYWYYYWFKRFGPRLLSTRFGRKMLSVQQEQQYAGLVKRYGAWMVVAVRFVPGGLRNPTFAICGLSQLPQLKFIVASLGTACFTSQITFWLGYWMGDEIENFDQLIATIEANARIVILVVAALFAGFVLLRRTLRRLGQPRNLIR